MKIKGFDDLERQLKKMQKGVKELERTKEIPFEDLFTANFMRRYTDYGTISDFLDNCGYPANTTEEFSAIPDAEFDKYVAANTRFSTWEKMLEKATDDYIVKKLDF
jgi:hypothetical protein